MKQMWELKQSATPNKLELYIYGDVEGDGWDWWTDEVVESETSANHFRDELGKHPEATEIAIYINSYGGSVFEGTAIYSQLRRHKAHKTVYVDGFACSIASVIAMAGDTIIMPRNTMMMIHNMWMGVHGNANDLRKAADNLDIINAAGRKAYLEKAGDKLTEDKLVEMMDGETWLTAEQCVEMGLADQFADQDADLTKAGDILQKANLSLKQRVSINKSLSAQLKRIAGMDGGEPPEKPTDPPQEPEKPEQKTEPSASLMEMLAEIF